MSGRQKILEEIHPLALIREVQRQPALYTRNAELASAHHKQAAWCAVAAALVPDWDRCSARSKEDKALIKKWRNLRDTFKRQLEIQKKIREGASIKRKQYVYFKHMSFLTPHMADDVLEAAPAPAPATRRRDEEPSFASSHDFGDIDEDKHFLMSLIPSFKRMNEDEKLTAKMEILKVIKMVKENSASTSAMELSYELVPERAFDEAALAGVKLEGLGADGGS